MDVPRLNLSPDMATQVASSPLILCMNVQNLLKVQVSLPYALRVSLGSRVTKPRGNLRFLVDIAKLPSIYSTNINWMSKRQAWF